MNMLYLSVSQYWSWGPTALSFNTPDSDHHLFNKELWTELGASDKGDIQNV